MRKHRPLLVKALHFSSLLTLKIAALEWVKSSCEIFFSIYENLNQNTYFYEPSGYVGIPENLVLSVLEAASDREPKVRSHVALVLELLLQARLIHPICFYSIAEVVLERLGDPDVDIKNAFIRLLPHVLPTMMFACALSDSGIYVTFGPGTLLLSNGSNLHWKQVFALKQLRWQLHSQ